MTSTPRKMTPISVPQTFPTPPLESTNVKSEEHAGGQELTPAPAGKDLVVTVRQGNRYLGIKPDGSVVILAPIKKESVRASIDEVVDPIGRFVIRIAQALARIKEPGAVLALCAGGAALIRRRRH